MKQQHKSDSRFVAHFKILTGNEPFPWQQSLFSDWLSQGRMPAACIVPTGLGKTSVIAVWLLALAAGAKVPRRLVYVVNRRTVVDQTTDEVESIRRMLENDDASEIRAALAALYHPDDQAELPLAISTLRGAQADNREWSGNPAKPAVICGTVDMIGSRLLFSGYGIGFKQRPLHAAFLGQDALLVHDEAHLEPAFQTLIETIRDEQLREPAVQWPKLEVMELTATTRSTENVFRLTLRDHENNTVKQRIRAKKTLSLQPVREEKQTAEQIAGLALEFKDSGSAILVFVRKVDDVKKVCEKLAKQCVETLTGTMRGKERDELVKKPTFARFLPNPPKGVTPIEGTVYLVCTSAGEVGVNISADHLVCDLSTFDSMAQRFGRVNRFGKFDGCQIQVVHSTEFKEEEYDVRRFRTLSLLEQLNGDASPAALDELPLDERQAAFAPTPVILPATDMLFDAWALTTIREKLPGRPHVEPFLHGVAEWEPPLTYVAWRQEVAAICGDQLLKKYDPKTLLEEYPLRPHEILKENSDRAFKEFENMARRLPAGETPVWLVDDDGDVEVLTLEELADKDNKERVQGKTVMLPPSAGGLRDGMLDGKEPKPDNESLDVADSDDRRRVWNDEKVPSGMRLILKIVFPNTEDEDATSKVWRWFERANEGAPTANEPVELSLHVGDVERFAGHLVRHLPLTDDLRVAVCLAAKFHDDGKQRHKFQRMLGNTEYPQVMLAKSGGRGLRSDEIYRHEFGSLFDVQTKSEFTQLSPETQDLVLHLIAAHHGRGRPHVPADEVFDPEQSQSVADALARSIPRRFARLQRKYGRWGLAYLESLLRAADWAASAKPSATLTKLKEPV